MSFTDPIGDFLTRLRNAQHGRHTECHAPWSKIKQSMCELLKKEKYIADTRVEGEAPHQEVVAVFRTDRPVLTLKRVSTPGGRKYVGFADIRRYLHGNSLAIISTSAGIMTGKEAKEKKLGGEILCTIS